MFCFELKFKTWLELIWGEIEDMVDPTVEEDVLMSDDLLTQKTTMFEAQVNTLHLLRVPGIFHSNSWVTRLYHMSLTDWAIHFERKMLPRPRTLQQVDWNVQRELPRRHSSLKNGHQQHSLPVARWYSMGRLAFRFWSKVDGKARAEEHWPDVRFWCTSFKTPDSWFRALSNPLCRLPRLYTG